VAPDGWLYVEVPDAARYGECLIAPFQDFNLEHINHFSAGSLRNTLATQGWHVAEEGAKTLALGDGRGYPAVFAFARPAPPVAAATDAIARDALATYTKRSAACMRRIEPLLEALVAAGPIAVWGVGQFTMRLLGDSNPIHQGHTLASRPIVAPRDLGRLISADTPIVIGSLVNLESIEASIRNLRLPNRVIRLSAAEVG
jgi:hypothetical protein